MASQAPFPLMPPKATELRLEHFDEAVYSAGPSSLLYKFVDAMCGDSGAGSLKKEIFLQRLSAAMDGIYGSDLDHVFGNSRVLSRETSESYPYNTMTQMLTSEQWDEVASKDAAYRARVRSFFRSMTSGGTAEGVRQAFQGATSSDCLVLENWRWIDGFGLQQGVGRSGVGTSYAAVNLSTGHRVHFQVRTDADNFVSSRPDPSHWDVHTCRPRSEFTVVPHKAALTEREARLVRETLRRLVGPETVVTVERQGLAVMAPVPVRSVAADSSYFQVEKTVVGAPVLADLPPPELLAVDLDPTERWLKPNTPELAPYAQFNATQEHGYCYLVSGGRNSPIDEVTYGTLAADGSVVPEPALEWYEQGDRFGPWTPYEKSDSPDNYPGGRDGLDPTRAPALDKFRAPYKFPYASQAEYVAAKRAEVLALGGETNETRYRLPLRRSAVSRRVYTPDLAVAYSAPARESTVTSSWTSRKPTYTRKELRNPSLFSRGG